MVRPILIDMNPNELKYYLIVISFNKCTRICNVLSPKISFRKETKGIMIKNKDEAKAMNIFRLIVNANLIVQHKIQNESGTKEHVNVNVKIIISVKKIITGILVHGFLGIVSI